ncbi:MAG: DUF6152 family protein [Gammaproteobacteria bacterium]
MRPIAVLLTTLLTPVLASGHHGSAYYYDVETLASIEGVIVSASWRNPHVMFELERTFADGSTEIWEIESASWNGLQRVGIGEDDVAIGEHVTLIGALSRTGLPAMAGFIMTLDNGTDIPIWPQRARRMGQEVRRVAASAAAIEAARNSASGIFRVWARPGIDGQLLEELEPELPYNDVALAGQADWDPLNDDPVLNCTPRGMPSIMNSPQPIRFFDQGDTIRLRLEEWDGERIIHMNSNLDPANQPNSRLGFSTGVWDDGTLVVTTSRLSDPYFDDHGTPQGQNAGVVERFTLSADETRLDYEAIHTDPHIFTGPGRLTGYWDWVPGEEVKPYDCVAN